MPKVWSGFLLRPNIQFLNIYYAFVKPVSCYQQLKVLLSATESDGRIHTNFQQTVAATGRLSSTEPNLQNIPIRTEEGRKIRDCFVAQSPYVNLLTADYSQIEMRIMAHLSNDKGLIAAFETGEDLHSTVASQVFNVKPGEVDAEMRRTIKAMSYGLAYGTIFIWAGTTTRYRSSRGRKTNE